MDEKELYSLIEGLLFVSDVPLTVAKLREIFDLDQKLLKSILSQIHENYAAPERGIFLEEVAGGFQFRTKPHLKPWILKLKALKPNRLSQAALETLAMVAYKQPVTRAEIEEIRGVDTGHALRTLVDKKLVRIVGKKEAPGAPLIYGTTGEFLELFGLKDLKQLPTLEEVRELEIEQLIDPFRAPTTLLLPPPVVE